MGKREKKRGGCGAMLLSFLVGVAVTLLIVTGIGKQMGTSVSQTYALNRAVRIIEKAYYKPVDTEALYLSAIRGAVASLEDPYAAYYTKEEYEAVLQAYSGEYRGIGISLGARDDETVYISKVYDDSPASKAGVTVGDTVLSMMGKTVSAETMEEILAEVKANPDGAISLAVERDGETLDFELKQEKIQIKRVHMRMIGDVAVIKIDEFHGDCVKEFAKALDESEKEKAKALVLDLRGNPGGGLTEAKGIANMILDKGVLMSIRTRDGKETFEYTDEGTRTDLPLVVLINEKSASASEMLTGALQDRKAAVVVGVQSYGKGIVQTTVPIPFMGHIKLTTAGYYTPSGHSIHETGITPDVIIALPEDARKKPLHELTQEEDTQLQKAIEIQKQKGDER